MTYTEAAVAAKEKARDILRTAMAVRIMGRIEDAKAEFISSIKSYANTVVSNGKLEAEAAEAKTKRLEKRDAFTQALGEVEGLTAEDLSLITESVTKAQAENDKKADEDAEADAKYRSERLVEASKAIVEARKEHERNQANLAKLEAGEMKVDKDELDALTSKLLEDFKSSPEGSVAAA